MMPVAHILQNVNRSLDVDMYGEFDWFKVLANKVSHAHFDALTDTILGEGFTLPIVLVGNDVDGYCVGNGHHRLCVAILTGISAIPVIVDDEGDYWAFEDSHDGEWNPGERSFEYWGMLEDNIPDGYWGDGGNEVHRGQFGNRPTGGDDDYSNDCDYCDIPDNGNVAYEDHRLGCPEREYELVYCVHCGYSHYRYNACEWMLADIWQEAIAEHRARGFLPNGMWHPAYILTSAYDENVRRERAALVESARADWIRAINDVRAAVERGAGEWAMVGYIEIADALYREFCAI